LSFQFQITIFWPNWIQVIPPVGDYLLFGNRSHLELYKWDSGVGSYTANFSYVFPSLLVNTATYAISSDGVFLTVVYADMSADIF
jgi:hypothetical protein